MVREWAASGGGGAALEAFNGGGGGSLGVVEASLVAFFFFAIMMADKNINVMYTEMCIISNASCRNFSWRIRRSSAIQAWGRSSITVKRLSRSCSCSKIISIPILHP